MTNLRLIGFLILGLALSMGIILWFMHERLWGAILFVLAALQGLIIILNWNKERRGKHHHKS